MQTKQRELFTTVHAEGAILPADLLQRIADGAADVEGLKPGDYHLNGEKLNEAINRSWNRLQGAWASFQAALEKLPELDLATTVSRERWLLPLFQQLGYGRLLTSRALELEGKSYPISHAWHHTPIHLVGWRVDLDRRIAGVAGAARSSPHSLVQELLNRSDQHLWAFVSNGRRLRILRDNASLTRQAYVEFDLEALMEGQVYADFTLLWLLCHESRVEAERPEESWLERWSRNAHEQGIRALDQLRRGVEEAIIALGSGFLAHPANAVLRENLRSGELAAQDYYRQLLRLVYRLLFLFVAEDRDVLLDPAAEAAARQRYQLHYSSARLRRSAQRLRGTRHADLYHGLRLVMQKLHTTGCPELALLPLGSFLWSPDAIPDLNNAEIANHDLLDAVRALAFATDAGVRRPVDYKNLGSEELGSVYESLLELHPVLNADAGTFELRVAAGHERKTTGSYYTHPDLVRCLFDSALDPVLDETARKRTTHEAEKGILDLKICDPACGSGHFLIAAAHRMAKRLAAIRTGDEEPAPEAIRHGLRDIVGRCLYGVDVNPMAVELCKVALWMEALEPGKPLSFLDHHVQCGNSLLGTTPALLAGGIPDVAFKPIEGDAKVVCNELKRDNKKQRKEYESGQGYLFAPLIKLGNLPAAISEINLAGDVSLKDVEFKRKMYERAVKGADYLNARLLADTWCAVFVWKKDTTDLGKQCPTERDFRSIETNPHSILPHVKAEVLRLAEQYQFFHWHLAFPDVFRQPEKEEKPETQQTGWNGGFDVVLGNPPWIRQELLKPIKQLLVVFDSFRSTADSSVFFLERALTTTRLDGRIGMLTPNKWFRAGYAQPLRRVLRENSRVRLLVDFGHSRNLFPDADTFPAAVALQPIASKAQDSELARFVQAHDADREQHSLNALVAEHAIDVPHSNLRPARWQLESIEASQLLDRLMTTGTSLGNVLDRPIVRGILTGFNRAFYVDTALRNDLIDGHPASESLIRQFLRGRDVKRWVPHWDGQWHIVIPSSYNRQWPWSSAENDEKAEDVFAATHPSLYRHLKQFEVQLRQRQDKGKYWWELRACDYYEAFEIPKLVVQCIAYYAQFAFDNSGHYVNNKAIVIPSSDLTVLAVLNSRIMWWLVNRTFQHMKDDGLSVDVQYLLKLPIPTFGDAVRREVETIVRELVRAHHQMDYELDRIYSCESRLNELVSDAFHLSTRDRSILEKTLPPRDPLVTLESQGAQISEARRPAAVQVEIGRAAMYAQILLHTWNKPVAREALEAGLVLMLNDTARQRILTAPIGNPAASSGQAEPPIRGMDQFLTGLVANQAITQRTAGDRVAFEIGADAVPLDKVPQDDRLRGREAVQAVEALGASRVASVYGAEAAYAEFELVS